MFTVTHANHANISIKRIEVHYLLAKSTPILTALANSKMRRLPQSQSRCQSSMSVDGETSTSAGKTSLKCERENWLTEPFFVCSFLYDRATFTQSTEQAHKRFQPVLNR